MESDNGVATTKRDECARRVKHLRRELQKAQTELDRARTKLENTKKHQRCTLAKHLTSICSILGMGDFNYHSFGRNKGKRGRVASETN